MAARKSNSEELRYQIDQLRKSKIACAVESTALSMLALLLLFALVSGALPLVVGTALASDPSFAESALKLILSIPALFWLYTVVGNIMRFRKIKQLEKEL